MPFILASEVDIAGSVLLVCAHPDDGEIRAGGTLRCITKLGHAVYQVILTDGSKGTQQGDLTPAKLATIREQEQRAASKLIGVNQLFFFRETDGQLENTLALRCRLVWLIRTLKPDILITHDPWRHYQLHPDHRAAGFVTLDAMWAARDFLHFPELLDEGLESHRVKQLWLFNAQQYDFYVDISESLDVKLAALSCHVSQGNDSIEMREEILRRARRAGQQAEIRYAEPFKRIILEHD